MGAPLLTVIANEKGQEIISVTCLDSIKTNLTFGEYPALKTLIGAAIILCSGLYIFHRERRVAKRRHHHATLDQTQANA